MFLSCARGRSGAAHGGPATVRAERRDDHGRHDRDGRRVHRLSGSRGRHLHPRLRYLHALSQGRHVHAKT